MLNLSNNALFLLYHLFLFSVHAAYIATLALRAQIPSVILFWIHVPFVSISARADQLTAVSARDWLGFPGAPGSLAFLAFLRIELSIL